MRAKTSTMPRRVSTPPRVRPARETKVPATMLDLYKDYVIKYVTHS